MLVLSVDWFIGMARALGNLIGNCVATVVIGAWEGDLDLARATRVLNDPTADPTELDLGQPGLGRDAGRLIAPRGSPHVWQSKLPSACPRFQ